MTNASPQPLKDQIRRMTPVSAPTEQQAAIQKLSAALGAISDGIVESRRRRAPRCELVGPDGAVIPLPEPVFCLLARVAEVLAGGDAVTIVSVGKELTTQQAADLLNVSRQYLVRLVDEGRIPYTRTGKHRRLRIEDVLEFKEKRDHERQATLAELTQLSEELDGYDELK
jgi:excisionase family DNA binding protein